MLAYIWKGMGKAAGSSAMARGRRGVGRGRRQAREGGVWEGEGGGRWVFNIENVY
jgi:hypothetical protein